MSKKHTWALIPQLLPFVVLQKAKNDKNKIYVSLFVHSLSIIIKKNIKSTSLRGNDAFVDVFRTLEF